MFQTRFQMSPCWNAEVWSVQKDVLHFQSRFFFFFFVFFVFCVFFVSFSSFSYFLFFFFFFFFLFFLFSSFSFSFFFCFFCFFFFFFFFFVSLSSWRSLSFTMTSSPSGDASLLRLAVVDASRVCRMHPLLRGKLRGQPITAHDALCKKMRIAQSRGKSKDIRNFTGK